MSGADELTWEYARWRTAAVAAGMWGIFTFITTAAAFARFVWRRRSSSMPLVGSLFGLVALAAFPKPLSWQAVVAVLGVLFAFEVLAWLWPAGLCDSPGGSENGSEAR